MVRSWPLWVVSRDWAIQEGNFRYLADSGSLVSDDRSSVTGHFQSFNGHKVIGWRRPGTDIRARHRIGTTKLTVYKRLPEKWCRGAESSHRHTDFQSLLHGFLPLQRIKPCPPGRTGFRLPFWPDFSLSQSARWWWCHSPHCRPPGAVRRWASPRP